MWGWNQKKKNDEIHSLLSPVVAQMSSQYLVEIIYLKEQLQRAWDHIKELEDRLMSFSKSAMETFSYTKGTDKQYWPKVVNEKGEIVELSPEKMEEEQRKYDQAVDQLLGH